MHHAFSFMNLVYLALTLLMAASLGGCANQAGKGVTYGFDRPMTLGEFYGFCWPAQIDSNCMDDNLCTDFQSYLAQEHADKADCIKGCNELQTAKWRQFSGPFNCMPAINNATDWCEKYCRMYFDFGPPSTPEAQTADAAVKPDPGPNPMIDPGLEQMTPQKPQ